MYYAYTNDVSTKRVLSSVSSNVSVMYQLCIIAASSDTCVSTSYYVCPPVGWVWYTDDTNITSFDHVRNVSSVIQDDTYHNTLWYTYHHRTVSFSMIQHWYTVDTCISLRRPVSFSVWSWYVYQCRISDVSARDGFAQVAELRRPWWYRVDTAMIQCIITRRFHRPPHELIRSWYIDDTTYQLRPG